MEIEKILKKYDYFLPKELIAQEPSRPRDQARLLVYKKDKKSPQEGRNVFLDTFKNLNKYLPPHSVLVFNKTKVIPARLFLKKETGGRVALLYLKKDKTGKKIEALANKKLKIGTKLFLNSKISFTVISQKEKIYSLRINSRSSLDILKILEKYGHTPLPPYIKNPPLSEKELREKYQTVFAQKIGSVAAPTASLHFTKRLLKKLKKSGHKIAYLTLHVGLGTFAPLSEENLKKNQLHPEWYEIDKKTAQFLNQAKKEQKPIIAVGTTVVRALESAATGEKIIKTHGYSRLFIKEGYRFKFIDGLITNFHLPRSSLLMLVAALVGRKNLLKLYQIAIKERFRFFSFGDGMLIF